MTASRQTTDGVTYGNGSTDSLMTYAYNLSGGGLIEQQYPSGRKVKNTLDADGSLEMVQSRKNANSGYWGYANNFTYNAAGAVTSMQLGNRRWESTVFNSRLQPTQIALGITPSTTNLLDLDYEYGSTASVNNGNVTKQTITVPTVGSNPGFVATQTYSYDSLNRLKDADEKPQGWTQGNCDSDPTKCWKQTFVYDRYGNRTFDTTANRTTTIPTGCPTAVCNPSANASDNKLKTSDGYVFDNAGNTTNDAESRKFTYDAENKQVKVETVDAGGNPTGTIGEYFYDGDGKRVKKYVPSTGETTIFVYDAAGKLVAEYSTIVEPAATAKVSYLTNDHLGSPRITTDAVGQSVSRRDFMPFGEEIVRASYGADSVRQKFTGYERDGETELDFAQSRYHNFRLGRFNSPDRPFADQIEDDPQSWNLYLYVGNNPLTYRDPLGLWKRVSCGNDTGAGQCWEWEEGDDWSTLGWDSGIGSGAGTALAKYFEGEAPLGPGRVVDVSGFSEWWKGLGGIQQLGLREYDVDFGGGMKIVTKLAKPGMLKRIWDAGKKLLGIGNKARKAASGADDVIQYQKLKQLYRRFMSKPEIADPQLRAWFDKFWRDTGTLGNGSPMAAARNEAVTGLPTGGTWHKLKIEEGLTHLKNWLKNNPSASANDRHIAEQLILDIEDALL